MLRVSLNEYLSNRNKDVGAMTMTWEVIVFAEDYLSLRL